MLNCQDVFPKILFEIGPIKVRFYGTIIAFSAIITYLMIKKLVQKYPKKFNKKISSDDLFDLIFSGLVGGIIGARTIYILAYNFAYFWENPLEIFAVWQGGLSVHGGLIGGAIACYIFTKAKKWDFWQIADLVVPFLALGLGFGRIANFVNGELVGRATDFIYGCDFGDGVNRWPVQLIASAKDFLIFTVTLIVFLEVKSLKGFNAGLFLLLIGVLRFLVEFLREPDPQIGFLFHSITLGQIFALITAAFGAAIITYSLKNKRH